MKINKILTITLFIIFSSLTSITYAETLKFGSSTYEGDTKRGSPRSNVQARKGHLGWHHNVVRSNDFRYHFPALRLGHAR